MANGNLLPNWSFRRKLPEPFEDYSDDPVCKNVYSKYCTQPQKRSTLHAATLRAILAYMELESPTGAKPPEELGAVGSQGNNFTVAEYPSKTGELHVAVYNRTNGKFTAACYQMPPDPESSPEKYMLKEDEFHSPAEGIYRTERHLFPNGCHSWNLSGHQTWYFYQKSNGKRLQT